MPDKVHLERLTDLRRVDIAPGFCAITRSDRLRETLERVLRLGAVVTAAVERSILVGYIVDMPFVPIAVAGGEVRRRWQSVPQARELGGLEVARPYRCMGIGRRLLLALSTAERLQASILMAEGFEWHWDLGACSLSATERRRELLALFEGTGFRRYDTDEPEVSHSALNFLVAFIGRRVEQESRHAFEAALFSGQ